MPERDVVLGITPDDYDALASPFIEIPVGASGQPKAGDKVWVLVEAQANIGEKTPGVSYVIPLMVMEDGVNKGKVVDWVCAYSSNDTNKAKAAIGIAKRAFAKFGVEDKVIRKIKGKTHLLIDQIAGAQAKACFVREWSKPQVEGKSPILRAKLDSTQFLGADEKPMTTIELV